jgi:aminomethyltransferase
MGRLCFHGRDAERLLDRLLTCRVDNLVDGQIRYGLVCNETGGILDDVLVNRINATAFGLVVNASNREKIVAWISRQITEFNSSDGPLDVVAEDHTIDTGMIAVQGPQALVLVKSVTKADLASMRYYTGREIQFDRITAFVSRTGYTGEDGFELILPKAKTQPIWEAFLAAGQSVGLRPCGLGCRDTLRLEAAMPLYGHELSETIDPLTAGLGFAVKLDKSDFIGKAALTAIKEQPKRAVRVGLKLASRRIAREHSEVFSGTDRIGEVASGTFSPTLEQSIAMAYVTAPHAGMGTPVEIDIRGKREPAEVVSLPFYKRTTDK